MRNTHLIIAIAMALLLPACSGSGNAPQSTSSESVEMRHARNIRMEEPGEGATLVTLRNPWDTTKTMARYLLLEKDARVPENIPAGTVTIQVPLERSVVYSGVHVSLLAELGTRDAVLGICDANYIRDPETKAGLESGKIADCGRNTSPNVERIVSLRPQAIILSPYETSDESERFSRTGITVVEAADYMEPTPLGRAEWMRFYGRLFGKSEKADSMFQEIEKRYNGLAEKAGKANGKPKVLFDRIYGGMWNVPTSTSVTNAYITDAGGSNPFDYQKRRGTASITPEETLYRAQDADIWLVRYTEPTLTLDAMSSDNTLYTKFRAFKDGNVFGVNTLNVPIFENGAFHPDLILSEMVRLLHPEICDPTDTLRYYKKVMLH